MKRWIALAGLLVAHAPGGASASEPRPAPQALAKDGLPLEQQPAALALAEGVARMSAAFEAMQDVVVRFHKREWMDGDLLERETILLKSRKNPRAVYLKWIGEARRGQEVIWRPGWNGDRLRGHRGSFPDLTANLALDSYWANRGTRHPVSWAGFGALVGLLARDVELGRARPDCVRKVEDLGVQAIFGQESRGFDVVMDKDRCPGFYARRARFFLHQRLRLPTEVKIWDFEGGALRLIEDYGFEDIRVDVGLTDRDFDPDNEAYDF